MKKILLILSIPFAVSSCKNMMAQISEMMKLKSAIQERFHCKNVQVNINITNSTPTLNISIANSPYNDSTDEVKQKIADSIGVITPQYFHSVKIKDGYVLFAVDHNNALIHTIKSTGFSMHLK